MTTKKKPTSPKPKLRGLIVDDHPLIRFGLAQLLNTSSDLECCGEAESVAAARKVITKTSPDFVLLDLSLGDGDGFELITEWKRAFPTIKIIVISRHDEAVYAERSLRSGADGFLTKEDAPAEVLRGVRAVIAGRRHVSAKLADAVERRLAMVPQEPGRAGLDSLSKRELQVFRMLGEGRNNKEIAQQLTLSPKTVETYRDNIKRKLGLHDSVSLIRCAASWTDRR